MDDAIKYLTQLAETNAAYIQQLNSNMAVFEQNIDTILNANKETTRDIIALQKAVLQFLAAKKIIENEDDIRLFQKLHMKNIAEQDQQMAQKRDTDPDKD